MTNGFRLEELLCVYPFANFEVVSRGKGMNVSFTGVVENIDDMQGGELVLLQLGALRGRMAETISKVEEAQGAAVLLTGREEQKSLLYKLQQQEDKVPILFYLEDLSLSEIENTLQLINHLKNLNQFPFFIKNSTYHIVNEVTEVGIEDFLSRLEEKIGKKIVITDLYFKELFRSMEREPIPKSLRTAVKNQYLQEKAVLDHSDFLHFNVEVPSIHYSVRPLLFHHSHVGYILIEGEKVSTFARLQFEGVIPVLTAELKKKNELLHSEKKYQKNFIYDLLHNNFESQYIIINQARNWGWDLTVPHLLLLMELKSDKESFLDPERADQIEKMIKNTLSALFYHSIIIELNGLFVILIPFDQHKQRKEMKEEAKRIAASIVRKIEEQRNDSQISFGIGRFYPTIINICRSYQEAKMALEFGREESDHSSITHFEDLGIIRLLANVRQELLEEFSSEYLGELAEYDIGNEADLLETLQVYLSENGNLKATADKLYIHINTLRNRLKKIENVLHIDLQNYDDLFNLFISLKITNINF